MACGVNKQTAKTTGKYRPLCKGCHQKRHGFYTSARGRQPGYTAAKKGFCEACGFVAQHPVQLDVDHIDGDHTNDDPSNWQTLCANCHRLKTYLAGECHPRAKRGLQ